MEKIISLGSCLASRKEADVLLYGELWAEDANPEMIFT